MPVGDEDPTGGSVMMKAYMQSLGLPLTADNYRRALEGNARVAQGRTMGDAYVDSPTPAPQPTSLAYTPGPGVGQSGNVAAKIEAAPSGARRGRAPGRGPSPYVVDSGSFDIGDPTTNMPVQPDRSAAATGSSSPDVAVSASGEPIMSAGGSAPTAQGFNVGRLIMDNLPGVVAGAALGPLGYIGGKRLFGGSGSPNTSAQPTAGIPSAGESPPEPARAAQEGNRFGVRPEPPPVPPQQPPPVPPPDPMANAMNKAVQPQGTQLMEYDPATGTISPRAPEPPPSPADIGRRIDATNPPRPTPNANAGPAPPQMPRMRGRQVPMTSSPAETIARAARLFGKAVR